MIVVDIETSGLYPWKHSILSIGAVDFLNPERKFYGECRLRKGAEIDQKALKINGFTQDDIVKDNKQSEKDLLQNFIGWVRQSENYIFGGHNIGEFDLAFINYTADRYNLDKFWGHRCVDLHTVVYLLYLRGIFNSENILKNKKSNIDSDCIMRLCGIPPEPKPHNALNGAKWETEAFSRFIYGKALFSDFSSYPVPEYLRI